MRHSQAGFLFCAAVLAAPAADAAEITASALFDAYESNEIVAEDSYNGRRISISGRIKAIKKATMGAPILMLDAGGSGRTIHCHFPKKAQTEVEPLRPGEQVTLNCRVKYRMNASIHASACRLDAAH